MSIQVANPSNVPELMIRVKLPESGSYHGSPSGDTEYDRAYNDAILSAKPVGFEVRWPRAGERWPVDSEGYTWVRLYCADRKHGLEHYIEEYRVVSQELARIRTELRKMVGA